MHRSELTGIILAGGKSSRMGREKGLVEFHGKPLIQYGIDLLARYTDHLLISSDNSDYLPFGLELVPDAITGQGPVAGLAASLQHSATPWNLVIACDLPFLEPGLIDILLESDHESQAVIPVHHGGMEPLVGRYHSDLATQFAQAVSSGNLALHKLLLTMKVHYLEVGQQIEQHPRMFTNFNTMNDLEKNSLSTSKSVNL